MQRCYYEALGEEVLREVLPNGLTVVIVPRPGFTKKLAYFVTDFGAIHRTFSSHGETYTAPAGVAHFLEHKMFDLPGRDVSAEFAALGASVNAFTSFDMTAYYFGCTDHFSESLHLLLEFVSTGYFTAESVDKEQGIIGQEIGMYEDNPESKIFDLLMGNLYRNHPVTVPILGSVDSIAQITPEVLTRCHEAFYRPDNMLLCVVGDVDAQEVIRIANQTLPTPSGTKPEAIRQWDEEMTCLQPYREARMEVSMPMFQLGFKCEPLGWGEEAVRKELIGDLAAEALFGESSRLYLQLYEEGLIDSAFGGGFETVEGMAMLTAFGDSDDPQAVLDAILEEAAVLAETGISEEEFLRMKRSAMGRRIRGLDSFDSICFRVCAYHFSGFDYFRFPEVYETLTRQDLQDFLARVAKPERCSMACIYPNSQEETQ
jgi:predicted Zn-dependent peptidase